jgi:hypothetical protein
MHVRKKQKIFFPTTIHNRQSSHITIKHNIGFLASLSSFYRLALAGDVDEQPVNMMCFQRETSLQPK